MNETQILTLDFGSRALRGTLTLLVATRPGNSQLLNFNGLPALQNCVWLGAEGDSQVGQVVFTSGLALQDPQRVHQAIPFDARRGGESKQLANLLLSEFQRAASLENPLRAEQTHWETLATAPAGISEADKELWKTRLRDANFPNPRAVDSACAAVAWHTRAENKPGLYLVLDLGASASRAAVCHVTSDNPPQTLFTATRAPGGREFDRAIALLIIEKFDLDRSAPEIPLLTEQLAERCKEGFANAQSEGHDMYEILLTPLGLSTSFKFTAEDFEITAGALVNQIHAEWNRALYEWNDPLGAYTAVILVGGGAVWDFARQWARDHFDAARVWMDDYPAESIVRGLPYLVFPQTELPKIMPAPPTPKPVEPQTAERAVEKQNVGSPPLVAKPAPLQTKKFHQANPTSAFLLELLGWFGFLGVGWIFALGKTMHGAALLIGWWILLIVVVFVTITFTVLQNQALLLCVPIVLWLGVPFVSALFARRAALGKNQNG